MSLLSTKFSKLKRQKSGNLVKADFKLGKLVAELETDAAPHHRQCCSCFHTYHITSGGDSQAFTSISESPKVGKLWGQRIGSQKQTQFCSIFHHHHIVSVTILVMLIFFQLITRHLSTSERGVRLSLTIPETGWRSNQGRQNQDHSYDHNEHHNMIN